MKKLMTLALIALLSFGVASVSWAQEGAAGGQAATKTPKAKKHKSKKHKKSTKGTKDDAAAAPQ